MPQVSTNSTEKGSFRLAKVIVIKMNYRHIHIKLAGIILAIQIFSGTVTGFALFMLIRMGVRPVTEMSKTPLLLLLCNLVATVIISAIVSVFVIRNVLEPIKNLSAATMKVAKGEFDARVPVPPGNGSFSQMFVNFNTMAEELGNTEMFKKDFINSFSHEFKTPIVSIRGFAKQLQLDDSLTEEQKGEYIGFIVKEADRLSALATNILLLTKLENQQYITEKSTFYLDEQLRHAILLFEKQWTEKELELDIDMEEVQYTTDEQMLLQIWVNLLSNAVKFTPKGGTIGVKLKKEGERITVSVSDSGPGIDEKNIGRIFDKFYQVDPSHTTEGNGLGLALVKRITDLLCLRLSVTSEKGKGTVFSVII